MPVNLPYIGDHPSKSIKSPEEAAKSFDQMPINIKSGTELVDYPGPDASDFLPGVCYDGWTARSALSNYMAGEIDVWDYEDILDCLIAESQNPTPRGQREWDQDILTAYRVPPNIVASVSVDPAPLRSYGFTMTESNTPLGPQLHKIPLPFNIIKDPFDRQFVVLEYHGFATKMSSQMFEQMAKDPDRIMRYLEQEEERLLPPDNVFDLATWEWDENIGKWEPIAEPDPLDLFDSIETEAVWK